MTQLNGEYTVYVAESVVERRGKERWMRLNNGDIDLRKTVMLDVEYQSIQSKPRNVGLIEFGS